MSDETLLARARALNLNGIVSHWDELDEAARALIARLLAWEEIERARRSLERRIKDAKLGRFKAIADFDWSHPRRCNRAAIDELFMLNFLDEPASVVLLGPNGIGKTTIAQNVAHKALLDGNTVRFTTASAMLGDLASRDGPMALQRRLKHYIRPRLLVIDEVGYLSYGRFSYEIRDVDGHAMTWQDASRLVQKRHPSKASRTRAAREQKGKERAERRAARNTRQPEGSSTGSRPPDSPAGDPTIGPRRVPDADVRSTLDVADSACARLRSQSRVKSV